MIMCGLRRSVCHRVAGQSPRTLPSRPSSMWQWQGNPPGLPTAQWKVNYWDSRASRARACFPVLGASTRILGVSLILALSPSYLLSLSLSHSLSLSYHRVQNQVCRRPCEYRINSWKLSQAPPSVMVVRVRYTRSHLLSLTRCLSLIRSHCPSHRPSL